MKAITAILAVLFSLSLSAKTIIKCDLDRAGYQEWSYITFWMGDGKFKSIQFISGSGIYAYYNLPTPQVNMTDGKVELGHYGMDGHVTFSMSAEILQTQSETPFEAVATTEAGSESAVCTLKKPESLEELN